MTENRSNKDRAKSFGSSFLKAAGNVAAALTDSSARARITEIDTELAELQAERDYLISGLVSPLPNEKVSENYKPGAFVPKRSPVSTPGGGRLVQCKGRDTTSRYHRAHPGCPYVEQIHIAHDFTLYE